MKEKKSSETNDFIPKKFYEDTSSKICNSCKEKLPKILDRGICPYCGRKG